MEGMMLIREIMEDVRGSVHPDATVAEAAALLADLNVETAPVCDQGILVGAIRKADLARHAGVGGSDPAAARVRDVMDKNAQSCFADDRIETVGGALLAGQADPIAVLDRRTIRVVGLLRLAEVAAALVNAKFDDMCVTVPKPATAA
jgi:CBS domain-containing protein